MPDSDLLRRCVLAVEDEYFIAEELEQALRAAGAIVLGPVPSVRAALDLLQGDVAPEIAVLDVNLGGEMVYPVADALAARGVPFLFTTGYDQAALPERYAAVRRLEKPIELPEVLRELRRLLPAAA
ncbi:response regulator [Methylobacterium sp. P31]